MDFRHVMLISAEYNLNLIERILINFQVLRNKKWLKIVNKSSAVSVEKKEI